MFDVRTALAGTAPRRSVDRLLRANLPSRVSPVPPGTPRLVGARVLHSQPDTSFSNATVVIRDGRIAAIGPVEVTPPADARFGICPGRTVYAGFIDPYLTSGSTNRPVRIGNDGSRSARAGGFDVRATETGAGGYRFFGVPDRESTQAPGPRIRAFLRHTSTPGRRHLFA